MDAELRGLGYQPAGFLARTDPGESLSAVYLHQSLPIYAFLEIRPCARGETRVLPRLESFVEGGGRLTTTVAPDVGPEMGRFTAWVVTGGPRLLEIRAWGPGTPSALDGQHAGTLKAWTAGKRRGLPAERETLIPYLVEDHERLGERLRAAGWLPFPTYLRALFGTPAGVLKF